jgi:hypothetical protein
MSKLIVMISMLILWASAAYGVNDGGSANLDIMGSLANNTTFITPEGMPIVLDIVGSTTTNIQVGNPGDEGRGRHKDRSFCGPCGEKMTYNTPWDDFTRPLCYPWSSYIPTRYNQPFINRNPGYSNNAQGAKVLGQGSANP